MRWTPLFLVALLLAAPLASADEDADEVFCQEGGTSGTPGVSFGVGSCTYVQYRVLPPVYCPGGPDDNTICQGTIEP